MTKPQYRIAEQKAQDLLKKYQLAQPIINAFVIAKKEGLDIVTFDPIDKQMENVAGFLNKKEKKIYVNSRDAAPRKMFTVAHELGHYMLHRDNEYDVLYRYSEMIADSSIEQEANHFAANLLVPAHMFYETLSHYKLTKEDTEVLAQLFGVSTEMMKHRVNYV